MHRNCPNRFPRAAAVVDRGAILGHVILVNNLLYKQLAFQASSAISGILFAIDVDYTRVRVGAQLVGEFGITPSPHG